MAGVDSFIGAAVAARPDAVAVRWGSGASALTYGQLAAAASNVGEQLRGAGVPEGAAVGLAATNTIEFVLALFGIAAATSVPVPLDPDLAPDELDTRLSDAGAVAVIVAGGHDAPASTPITAAPVARLHVAGTGAAITSDLHVDAPIAGAGAAPAPAACALVMFTSGTTGRAKAVPLTEGNVAASVRGVATSLALGPADATVLVMPLFHGHGLVAGLLASLSTGGTVLLPEGGRFSAHRFWSEMEAVGATWYTGVPTIHQILLARAPQEYPGPDRVALRFIRTCSAPLAPAVADAIRTTFHAPIVGAYGMTETAHQATSVPAAEAAIRPVGTVGLPTSVEVRIAGDGHTAAAPGEVGEILVRGAGLTAGYLNDERANRDDFVDGWFHTGDLGRLDADGYLTVTGRIKELINRGGEKIAPAAVEAVLLSHPSVMDAAVFGVPDATYGERVEAAVALVPGAHEDEAGLRAYAATELSAAEVPDHIRFLDQLPHTAKGAPDRRALAAAASPRSA